MAMMSESPDFRAYFKGKKVTIMGLGPLGNPRFSNALRAAFLHGEPGGSPTPSSPNPITL